MDVWPAWIRCGLWHFQNFQVVAGLPNRFLLSARVFYTPALCSVRAALLQPSNIFQHLPISSHIFHHLPTFQFHKTSSSPVGDGPPQPVVEAKRSLCYQYVVCIKAGLRRYSEVYEGNSGHVMIANREMSTGASSLMTWAMALGIQFATLRPRATAIWVRDFRSIRVPQHWLDFLDPWTFVDTSSERKKHRVQS